MRVLAIGAHPDDVEILCAGTLAHYAAAGHDVTIAVATRGDVGSPTLSREVIAAIRHDEAAAAASMIGAELIWLGFDDEWLFDDRPTRARFVDAIRQARPDVMFVHNTADYHPDHRNAGSIATDARIPAAIRLVETNHPALERIPHVFVMDTLGRIDFQPEVYVDITDTFDTKRTMLQRHASQDEWLHALYGMSYLDFITEQATARGGEVDVRYAEAFRELKTYPSTGTPDLLPHLITAKR